MINNAKVNFIPTRCILYVWAVMCFDRWLPLEGICYSLFGSPLAALWPENRKRVLCGGVERFSFNGFVSLMNSHSEEQNRQTSCQCLQILSGRISRRDALAQQPHPTIMQNINRMQAYSRPVRDQLRDTCICIFIHLHTTFYVVLVSVSSKTEHSKLAILKPCFNLEIVGNRLQVQWG